jgi:hypothetical protein
MKCYKRNVKLFIIIKKLMFIKEIIRSNKIKKIKIVIDEYENYDKKGNDDKRIYNMK